MPKKPLLLENLSSRNRTLFLQGISGTYGGSIQISEDGTSIIRIKGEKDMEQNITDNTNKKERSIKTREERDNEEYLDENGISGSEYGEYEDVDDNNESNLADGNNQQIKIPKNKSLQRMGINEEIDQGRIFNVNIPMERRDQRIIPVLNLPDNYDEEDDEDYGEENEEDQKCFKFEDKRINRGRDFIRE
ncbi:MAG: hypothetical protein EZS28_047795 [Streblomastix strix]|uniref:Uncharacterized protein n=1 Tax=Streblomastix strix TaxID=222440 RepID=A0A5J4TEP1_9EUKA|nr:MAG: hypothetical protein EZS28_047795 [Streblomastix strix]